MCLWTFWSKQRDNDPLEETKEDEEDGVPELITANGNISDDDREYHQTFTIYEKVSSPQLYTRQQHTKPSLSPYLLNSVEDVDKSLEGLSKEEKFNDNNLVFDEYVPKNPSPEVLKREVLQFRNLQFNEREEKVPRTRNRSSPGIIESDGQDNILIFFEERSFPKSKERKNVVLLKQQSAADAARLDSLKRNSILQTKCRKVAPAVLREVLVGTNETTEILESRQEVEVDGLILSKWYNGTEEYPTVTSPPTEADEDIDEDIGIHSIEITDLVSLIQESKDIEHGRANTPDIKLDIATSSKTVLQPITDLSPQTRSPEAPAFPSEHPIACNPATSASVELIKTRDILSKQAGGPSTNVFKQQESESYELITTNATLSQQIVNNELDKPRRRTYPVARIASNSSSEVEVDGFVDFLNPNPSSSPNQDPNRGKTRSSPPPRKSSLKDPRPGSENATPAAPSKYNLPTFTSGIPTSSSDIPHIETPESERLLESCLPKSKKNYSRNKQPQQKRPMVLKRSKSVGKLVKNLVGGNGGDRDDKVDKRNTSRKVAHNVYEVEKREQQWVEHKKKSDGRTAKFKKKVHGAKTSGRVEHGLDNADLAALVATGIILSREQVPLNVDYDAYVKQKFMEHNSLIQNKHVNESGHHSTGKVPHMMSHQEQQNFPDRKGDAHEYGNKIAEEIEQDRAGYKSSEDIRPDHHNSAPEILSKNRSMERIRAENLSRSERVGLNTSMDKIGPIRNEEWDPDIVSSISAYSFANLTTTSGQNVMNVDRRGFVRGHCSVCNECEQYEVVNGLSCEYCGCPPGKHENLGLFPKAQLDAAAVTTAQPSYSTFNNSHGTLNTPRPSTLQPPSTSQAGVYSNAAILSHGGSLSQVYKLAPPEERVKVLPKTAQSAKLRPVSLMDLPGTMTVDDARRFLSLQRSKSTESDVEFEDNSSCPDFNYKANISQSRVPNSQVIEKKKSFNSPSSSNSAYDRNSPSPNPNTNRTEGDIFEEESDDYFETTDRTSDTGVQDLDFPLEKLSLSRIPEYQIIPMNGGDVIRAMVKGEIQLIVDIIPNSVKKQHVMWFHNSRKISPRYRVRFVNDRREVHILSLRKKDAGVYKCQVKYTQGKDKQKVCCTMVLDVQVPEFVAKASK